MLQMHSCTGLTLDAVGTPTGCRLRREPWIRLSGRPSRERSPCGARSGEGEGHRCTLVPVLPSMPWARPQAAGCAGSRGSDCQDGHRGREAPAVQGAEREKVTDALSYRSYPRCRGHAHRLPAAPGAMDQTVRTAIEGRRSLRCKGTGKGENHRCTLVPVLPSMPSLAFSSRVIRATRPGADSAKDRAACTLGSMEPGAN